MPVLNYTTTIDAYKTVSEIEYILIKHKAKSIMKNMDDNGAIESLSFLVDLVHMQLPIKLPVDIDGALNALQRDKIEHPKKNIKATKEQAERVAWRVLKDWIEVQMALVDFKQAKMEQIFMPYIVSSDGETLFQKLENKQFLIETEYGGAR